jgi:hypothetical protein
MLQAVGNLVAKATGEFRRTAAKRMPNRMNKYGLKRLDILPCSLCVLSWIIATPMPTSPYAKNVLIFQPVWLDLRERAYGNHKFAFDNIVEGIESPLNNLLKLEKSPSRRCASEETPLSKLK